MKLRGRVHRFGDDVNTDYIIPAQYKGASLDIQEIARHTFEDIDPDFVKRVQPGDVVVAGSNFGCGSSRETAAHVLKVVGVSCVLASSFARIFFRNAINTGLPVAECHTTDIEAGDEVEVDLARGVVVDLTRGLKLAIVPLPAIMMAVLQEGGVVPYLKKHGDLVLPRGD